MVYLWATIVFGVLSVYFYRYPEFQLPFGTLSYGGTAQISWHLRQKLKFTRKQIAWAGFALGLFVSLLTRSIIWLAALPALAYLGWEMIQKRRGRAYENIIKKSLLSAIELLWIPCDAGLSFREAVRRLARETSNPVIKEIKRCYDEMAAGKRREAAYRDLVKRTVPEVESLVRAVSYTEEMGEPISIFLEREVERFHMEKRAKIQEIGDKIGDRILIIVIVVMGPAFMTLLFAPLVSRFTFLTELF